MIFNETELKLIYANLIGYVGLNPNIDYKSEKAIAAVLDKIEGVLPEISRHLLSISIFKTTIKNIE
ncbi:hypothetical protein [Tepidibacter hydrothermalis]|uniref:Uncharacterized protein n=1 Tax=Tepidibacter hydrothermalis TaxID=3036126 RepID=A0ABY8EGY6_9FIRM|nr:hypothetical protein [Tepidibacter hydrothermalis]WFD10849.1 hypothetical protein P4S50_01875 [Tepidibacter hydrothermalis]